MEGVRPGSLKETDNLLRGCRYRRRCGLPLRQCRRRRIGGCLPRLHQLRGGLSAVVEDCARLAGCSVENVAPNFGLGPFLFI